MVHRHIINGGTKKKKKNLTGNSLAVQWLGLCTSTAGSPGSIPSQRTKVPQDTGHSKKKRRKKLTNSTPQKLIFRFSKDIVQKVKRQTTEWKKISVKHIQ